MCEQIHLERKAIMKMNKKNATDELLSTELLSKIDAYWRAADCLLVGQGMALLAVASDKYEYHLNLQAVAGIW
jgi:6-phosphogluconate dehydrogenase